MTKDFEPMSAAKMPKDVDIEKYVRSLTYPLYASPKLDGIRCVTRNAVLTKKLKPVPNRHIRATLKPFRDLDGELMVNSDETDPRDRFRVTSSGVMSHDGEPDFVYHVFDWTKFSHYPFKERLAALRELVDDYAVPFIKVADHRLVRDWKGLLFFEEDCLIEQYEGVILRDPAGLYKFGRSTIREQYAMKLTRRQREEGTIIGFEERMHNANPKQINELGRTKRSSHKENLIPRGDLGAFIITSKAYHKSFNVGTGFTDAERAHIWKNKKKYLGKVITFEHKPYGQFEVPRQPTYVGLRDKRDM